MAKRLFLAWCGIWLYGLLTVPQAVAPPLVCVPMPFEGPYGLMTRIPMEALVFGLGLFMLSSLAVIGVVIAISHFNPKGFAD